MGFFFPICTCPLLSVPLSSCLFAFISFWFTIKLQGDDKINYAHGHPISLMSVKLGCHDWSDHFLSFIRFMNSVQYHFNLMWISPFYFSPTLLSMSVGSLMSIFWPKLPFSKIWKENDFSLRTKNLTLFLPIFNKTKYKDILLIMQVAGHSVWSYFPI